MPGNGDSSDAGGDTGGYYVNPGGITPVTQVFTVTVPSSLTPGATYNFIVGVSGCDAKCWDLGNMESQVSASVSILLPPPNCTATVLTEGVTTAPDGLYLFDIDYNFVNSGSSNVVYSLPASVTYVSAGPNAVYNGSSNSVSWDLGNVSIPQSGVLWALVSVNAGVTTGTIIQNSATLNSAGCDTSSAGPANVTVQIPQLALTKSESATNMSNGDTVTYTLDWTAAGQNLQFYDSYDNINTGYNTTGSSVAWGYDNTLYDVYPGPGPGNSLGSWTVQSDTLFNHYIEAIVPYNSVGNYGNYPELIRSVPGAEICDTIIVEGDMQIPTGAAGATSGADAHMILACNPSQGITLKAAISIDTNPGNLFVQKNNIYPLQSSNAAISFTTPFSIQVGQWYTMRATVHSNGTGTTTFNIQLWQRGNPSSVVTLNYTDNFLPQPTCSGGWRAGWQADETAGTDWYSNLKVFGPGPIVNAAVTDFVPAGVSYIGSGAGGIYDSGTNMISWRAPSAFPVTMFSFDNPINWWGTVSCPGPIVNQFSMAADGIPVTTSAAVTLTLSGSCNTPTPTSTPTPPPITQLCENAGKDGVGTLSGVVNTYYPGTGSVLAGANSIPVGAPTGSGTAISTGDLLLVVQMQGASINSNNSISYGDGSTGSGYTALNGVGSYEYVMATGPVAGGSVPIQGVYGGGLLHTYIASPASTAQGQAIYQVIRVPQYSQATITTGLTAKAWDGSTGGILAIDVAGALNLNGSTVSVDGLGFRGGGGRQLNGASGGTGTDYVSLSTIAYSDSKGEGIAGTPHWVFNWVTALDVDTLQAYQEGYPNGSFARGAPGNAGGGGTDTHPSDNGNNSGGGGGGNGGAGGLGGNSFYDDYVEGGLGGAVFPEAANQVVMGGGGGAGDQNGTVNGSSSGGTGGGIIFVRACTVTGSGTFSANGVQAPDNPGMDAAGGGGAGGSVLVAVTQGTLAGLTVNATGGRGGNDAQNGPNHGPGGGGGGGVILLSATASGTNVSGGIAGLTSYNSGPTNYGALAGQNGIVATNITQAQIPGAQICSCLASPTATPTPTNTPTPTPTNTSTPNPASCCPNLGSVLFQDNYSSNASLSNYNFYNGDAGTPDSNYPNYFSASGGNLISTANPSYSAEQLLATNANFNPSSTDYTIQCDVMSAQVAGIFGIIFRGQTGADYYSFQINYGQWQFEKHTSGGWSYLSTASTPAYAAGSWVHMKVVCCGNNYTCYLNFNDGNGDRLIFNITDSTFTTGAVGIRSGYLNSPNQNKFENYVVNSCSPSAAPTPTPTVTPTPTITSTPTNTPTFTPTITPTPTSTPVGLHVWPNPFNPTYAVNGVLKAYLCPAGSFMEIYTVSGEWVNTEKEVNGLIEWDGRNNFGNMISAGIYYYLIKKGDQVILKGKLLVVMP